jgi:hypothetical protein
MQRVQETTLAGLSRVMPEEIQGEGTGLRCERVSRVGEDPQRSVREEAVDRDGPLHAANGIAIPNQDQGGRRDLTEIFIPMATEGVRHARRLGKIGSPVPWPLPPS